MARPQAPDRDEAPPDDAGAMPGPLTLREHDRPDTLPAEAWDALLAASPTPSPFLKHAYLEALHASGSAVPATGWRPCFLTLSRADGRLEAGCVLYEKSHSYGEYVFDWAWAEAWERAGQRYYPKLLSAPPFTPVPGSRLLARHAAARRALLQALEDRAREGGHSSAHLLFIDPADQATAEAAGWLIRHGLQFHWHNRDAAPNRAPEARPYADFDNFLAHLSRDRRRKIGQERRYVAEAGITLDQVAGPDMDTADWDFFYRCYSQTYAEHHSRPYLTRDFFARMAAHLPMHWRLVRAWRGRTRVASALIALDPSQRVAYGRYWGATEAVRCLHFEACYHQPIAWCIAEGWRRFEGGAQGEHKMARGLLPVPTRSAHWLAHPGFTDAVARFLEREGAGVSAYLDELSERRVFKALAEGRPASAPD